MKKAAQLLVVALLAGCGGWTKAPPASPPDWVLTGRYPGACGLLRVDAEGNRRRTEKTWDGERLISEVTFDESNGTRPSRPVRSRRYVYDAQGRQIRVDEFEGPSRRSSWMSYDEEGRWISTEVDATGKRDVVRRDERGYDEDGRVTYRRTVTAPDGLVVKIHTYEHDDKGAVVSERIDFPLEGRSERIEFKHDDRGRVAERLHHELPDDTLTQRDVYAFGPTGRLESMVRHGDVRLTQRYKHDEVGNLLRVDTWDDAGEPIAATVYDYTCWRPQQT